MRLVASHPSFELIYAAGEGSAGSRLVARVPRDVKIVDIGRRPPLRRGLGVTAWATGQAGHTECWTGRRAGLLRMGL